MDKWAVNTRPGLFKQWTHFHNNMKISALTLVFATELQLS